MLEKPNKLLILDLDETLIHSVDSMLVYREDFSFDKYFVYKRPFLNEFLTGISKYYSITTFFWATISLGQSAKEQDFALTLKKVVIALSKRDSASLSKYTNKKISVYILYRIGVMDTYAHFSTLGFSDTSYPNAPFYDNVKLIAVKYSKLPTYDCEKWFRTGTFVDTTQTDHFLSNIAKGLNREIKGEVSVKAINEFYSLENKSRRIVVADDKGDELIIYLSFLNKKWVVTIIDKATCDCSV